MENIIVSCNQDPATHDELKKKLLSSKMIVFLSFADAHPIYSL